MSFDPRLDTTAVRPLLDVLERDRQEIEALEVAPALASSLRRLTEARGAHMSTRIEGNPMTEQEVRESFARPAVRLDAAVIENLNYRDAVRFASQVADDAAADIDGGFIRALHFLVLREVDRYGTAGQYRIEQNAVRRGGEVTYLPPHPTEVPRLMDDLVRWMRNERRNLHPLVLAAVAHLEFVKIHPFDDGNGRTARALSSHMLTRSGWRLRGFVSVEQVFGADVNAYAARLSASGPRYPGQSVDCTDWVRWFLLHLFIETVVREVIARDWTANIASALRAHGIPARKSDGLSYLLLAGTVSRSEYAQAAGVSPTTAVSELNRWVSQGLATRSGRGPATRYTSTLSPLDAAITDGRAAARERLRDLGIPLE